MGLSDKGKSKEKKSVVKVVKKDKYVKNTGKKNKNSKFSSSLQKKKGLSSINKTSSTENSQKNSGLSNLSSDFRNKIKKQIEKEKKDKIKKNKVHFSGAKISVVRPKIKQVKKNLVREKVIVQKEPKVLKIKSTKLNIKDIKKRVEQELRGKKWEGADDSSDRVKTGILGLDEVMGGGFKRNSVNLVVGGPGSGKSTLAIQYLVNGINIYDENGVYISFEQKENEIIENFEQYGWDIKGLIKKKKMVILSYTPEQIAKVIEAGGGTVRDVIESIKAKRVVVDSLTAFALLHEDSLEKRKSSVELFESLKKWNTTTLLVAEQEPDPEKRDPTVEEFEVDGVILLYNIRKKDVRERALEIFKMRGTKHSARLFPLVITDEGILVYPEQEVF